MKFFILFPGLLLLTKNLFFWIWLWQLKEYHWGRFRAHFETEALKKILSSFWRVKFPVFTKKIIILSFLGFFFEIFIFIFLFSLPEELFLFWFLGVFFFSPLIFSLLVLGFQIPTDIFKKRILEKAKQKREKFGENLLVIGITGSYGKTSTKEFLATILSEKFGKDKVLKTKEHQNSEMGISQCILKELRTEHKIFVVEMAAYDRGRIKLLCDIAKPKIGIITGINQQHLGVFGSMENLLSAEGGKELIESLPEDGMAALNWDSEIVQSLKFKVQNFNLKLKNIKFCSQKEKLYFWAKDIKIEKEFISFKIFSKDNDSADFKINLLGTQNIENILLAAAVAKELGMSLEEISQGCQKIRPEQSGMKLIKNKINIIDSTYSTNPNAVFAHLEYLKTWTGRKIIVMPCLIELGKASKEIHSKIGEKIAEVCDLAIIATEGRFKNIKQGVIKKGGMKNENVLFIENPKKIDNKIKSFLEKDLSIEPKNDIILLEGRTSAKVVENLLKFKE